MRSTRHATLPVLAALALSLGGPARADETQDARNELVVFGGISLLDASRGSELSFDGNDVVVPAMRGFGRFARPPFEIPAVRLAGEVELGSSALFGARYSRFVKDRLALEADVTVAPSHDLELRGGACVGDFCIADGDGRFADGRFRGRLGDRNVTAWHYGAGLAYELTGGDVRPVLLLGAGGVTWDGSGATSTDFVLRFGAGLKVLFGRVGARVDVVDHLVLDHFVSGDAEHDVHASAGLLVRF